MKRLVILLMIAVVSIGKIFAVEAYPHPIKFNQPDGKTTLTITLKGDEKVSWAETQDGYSLLYNKNGYLMYATKDASGDMVPSDYMATDISQRSSVVRDFLAKTPKKLRYSKSQIDYMRSLWDIRDNQKSVAKSVPTTDTVRILVILAQFTNRTFVKTRQQIDNMFNQVNYTAENAVGSVYDYYKQASYNKLHLIADVYGPYTLGHNSQYYGRSGQGSSQTGSEFAYDALTAASNAGVNFSRYDNDHSTEVDCVHIIFAGYGRESGAGDSVIWSHKWSASNRVMNNSTWARTYSCSPELRGNSGSNISHVGVACHEIGHVLGAPDYYDTDYESNGQYPGMGYWDIMASGSWGGVNSQSGNSPAHHNAYTKAYIYHWIPVTTLSGYDTVTLRPYCTDTNSIYRINTQTQNEFYLIDNRQQQGFDASCSGHGLMFYHVHSDISRHMSGNDLNASHPQMIYPVCASLQYDKYPDTSSSSYGYINTAGCPFPGTSNKTSFTDFTTPWARSWAGISSSMPIRDITEDTINHTITFIYGEQVSSTCIAPTNLQISEITDDHLVLSWNRNASSSVWEIAYGKKGFDPSLSSRTRRLIRNVTAPYYTITNIDPTDTVYDIYVRSVCGAGDTSAWSTCINSEIAMHNNAQRTIAICGGIHVYDDGGETGNYGTNATSLLTINAASAKSRVAINGIFNREDYDELYIYDGPDTNGTLINHYYTDTSTVSGAIVNDTVADTSLCGTMTIMLVSDPYTVGTGFDFEVLCVDTSACNSFSLPYRETFTGIPTSAATTVGGGLPRCWTTYSSVTTSTQTSLGFIPHVCKAATTSPNRSSIDEYLVLSVKRGTSANRAYAILPGFEDTLTKAKISFKVRMNSNSNASNEALHVGYVSNYTGVKSTDTVFTALASVTIDTAPHSATINLHNYNIPNNARLAFRWKTTRTSGNSNYTCGVDDINLTSCEGTSTQYVVACGNSYTWSENNITYTSDTLAMTRLSGASATGCDSLIYLDLHFATPTRGDDTVKACGSYTWRNGVTYTASTNNVSDTIMNTAGCDSVIFLHLTMLNDTTINDTIVSCTPYTWVDSVTYSRDTIGPSYTYTTALGCDSTLVLNFRLAQATSSIDTVIACDSCTWRNGHTYTQSTRIPFYTITNADGCDSVIHLYLTIKHKPTVSVSADRTSINSGESVTLTASGALHYLWSTNSTNNPIIETPQQTTEYTVIGMNTNDAACMDTASITITVSQDIENAENIKLSVYPNPAQQIITVDCENLSAVTIYNTLGQMTETIATSGNKQTIDIANYKDGIYTMQVETANGAKIVKTFVIKKK